MSKVFEIKSKGVSAGIRVIQSKEILSQIFANREARKSFIKAAKLDPYLLTKNHKLLEFAVDTLMAEMETWSETKRFKAASFRPSMKLVIENGIKFQLSTFVSVSRKKSYYLGLQQRNHGLPITYGAMIAVLDFLNYMGYLDQYIGSDYSKMETRIAFTGKFKEFISTFKVQDIRIRNRKTKEPLVMKVVDPKSGEKVCIDYEETEGTREMIAFIEEYNTFLDQYNFEVLGVRLYPQIYRSFNDNDWEKGGRLYDFSYQSLRSSVRSKMLISGMPVVELDFKCNHFNIQYILRQGTPFTGDVYQINGLSSKDLSPSEREAIRDTLKEMFQAMVNTESKHKAIGSVRLKIWEHNKDCKKWGINAFIEATPEYIVEEILRIHAPVADFFFKNNGKTFQFIDSRIAVKILQLGMNTGIPILSVHDSFICQAQHEGFLIEAMKKASTEVLGTALPIKGQSLIEQFMAA